MRPASPAVMEAAVQLHLPTFRDRSLPSLVQMASDAEGMGFEQIWLTDNLQSRNPFVVLTAIASKVPIKLGTAITVQYFRSPLDVADSVAAITELMDGREFCLGIARGNQNTNRLLAMPKPVTFLREAAQSLRALFDGEPVSFGDYPALASYFNFVPEHRFQLSFRPAGPVQLYCGGNGPLSNAIGGQHMDGIIFGGTLLAAHGTGRLSELVESADQAARPRHLGKVAEIKISVSNDAGAAKEFVKETAASRMLSLRGRGYTAEDFGKLGIDPKDVDRIEAGRDKGASREDLAPLATDPMIDAIFVAGSPAECREKMAAVIAMARSNGFNQLMFSELGPDPDEALRLLSESVLPLLE
jgi:alkanesulfonate monooxygenase SsuD/methylene tetrahydromethanopterin reductase-like flavin-dependent oxidoreductase (luciferase family)